MHTNIPESKLGEPIAAAAAAAGPVAAKSTSSLPPLQPKKLLADSPSPPRILVIGAGSRGHAYASAVAKHTAAVIAAVAEPIAFKRREFVSRFITTAEKEEEEGKEQQEGAGEHDEQQHAFADWRDYVEWEKARRARAASASASTSSAAGQVPPGVDAAFVCVLDEQHREVVEGLAPLGLAVMCEKPLATTLADCVAIYKAMLRGGGGSGSSGGSHGNINVPRIFSIGHVLRYSPHNMLLRRLVREQGVVGDVLSVEHTEPVGWWHFSHSYVRGNWRRESTTAPSLLTKSCHDIDFLLWMLSEPAKAGEKAHKPAFLSSTGKRNFYRKARKPAAAGTATNCLSCPMEKDCMFSAKKIYAERHLRRGNAGWPVKIVNPEIEDCLSTLGPDAAEKMLMKDLSEDWTSETPDEEVRRRPWFGRCVWEADNDVCDDQCVTISWEDDAASGSLAKTAQFHMVAFTEKICERRGRIYGTKGEIEYDSATIRVHDFASDRTEIFTPEQRGGGHGGGDDGLATQFVQAVGAVKDGRMGVVEAQKKFIGCTLEEVVQSHAMVFAAEEARRHRAVVDWPSWWQKQVEERLQHK
ncbi:streptomycin biosynthesis protein [Diplodia corticola]|uniref:Streptomycin biosynthesis protein n=1 Tax=Diplodia corticola TaxID=236234 RepID=A0A1J9RI71_9PEZI|nr:streptomycin biosynthesis protein [Diplodia corticola]OJD39722.1 streptomycin biosynthesis protein [Diplodia corticola]